MKSASELKKQIETLRFHQDNFEEDSPEYARVTEQLTGLKQTLVVVYNATTTSGSVAFMRDGNVVIAD